MRARKDLLVSDQAEPPRVWDQLDKELYQKYIALIGTDHLFCAEPLDKGNTGLSSLSFGPSLNSTRAWPSFGGYRKSLTTVYEILCHNITKVIPGPRVISARHSISSYRVKKPLSYSRSFRPLKPKSTV
jgi:hypothetical protein